MVREAELAEQGYCLRRIESDRSIVLITSFALGWQRRV